MPPPHSPFVVKKQTPKYLRMNLRKRRMLVSFDKLDIYCKKCFVLFDTEAELTTHTKTCNKNAKMITVQCCHCSTIFGGYDALKEHVPHCPKYNTIFCEYCLLEFETEAEVATHSEICDKKNPDTPVLRCDYSAEFETYDQVQEHVSQGPKITDDEDSILCEYCLLEFKTEAELATHNEICVIKNPRKPVIKCASCSAKFVTHKAAKEHVLHCPKTKNVEDIFCEYCLLEFKTEAELATHNETCMKNPPKNMLRCGYCLAEYETKDVIKEHMLHCSKRKKKKKYSIICEYCLLRFESEEKCASHDETCVIKNLPIMVLEGGCYSCEAKFETDDAVRKHLLNCPEKYDFNEYPFVCEYCLLNFKTEEELATHNETCIIRNPPLMFYCDYCFSKFKTEAKLIRHSKKCVLTTLHTSISCIFCVLIFETEAELAAHYEICDVMKNPRLSNSCEYCFLIFETEAELATHIEICDKKNPRMSVFQCGFCSATFQTRDEQNAHFYCPKRDNNNKFSKFLCAHCFRKFETEDEIVTHMKICDTKHGRATRTSGSFLQKHLAYHHAANPPKNKIFDVKCTQCLADLTVHEAKIHSSRCPRRQQTSSNNLMRVQSEEKSAAPVKITIDKEAPQPK